MVPSFNIDGQNQHVVTILAFDSQTSNTILPDLDEESPYLDKSLSQWFKHTRIRAKQLWAKTRCLLPRNNQGNIDWSNIFFNVVESDINDDCDDDLVTISPRDRPWDRHRSTAELVERLYLDSDFDHYSKRIAECSQVLSFGLVPVDEEIKLKLRSTRSCRIKHCPVCLWRRSLMWKSKAHKLLPTVIKDYPKHRWIFLTLTLKNMPIVDLNSSLKLMKTGFERLSQVKAFPADGWIKSLEVTRGLDGSAHPHYHCLLMVKPSYFSHGYIKHGEWMAMWKKAMRFDYDPRVDIRVVDDTQNLLEAIPELLKYTTKPAHLTADKDWLVEYTHQMQNVRCISTGGILKKYLKELEKEPDDLIGKDDDGEEVKDDETRLSFSWRTETKKYKLVK
jgi:plasmid rolling circle replication initiator protein Rep